ncbi:phenylacetate--CoA ligase family protein [Paraburkholderia sp. Ac-20336]|uniref:phenylacetate--CoA ligase family protein n=1 Tax=unclassified Paraburkholderia TaxID=2615204 RepID=UPI00142158EB|nr:MULTISPECIES: phenylacetate--CoA ligase family protein [unclassified Paraburkholderia]MBN3804555.1 phenylacetate--CoA ligase family protein [Paraburkholderia sp. Ac-20336]NIF80958.1 phenylacetate--CoA ligase family protein [Paraburkholderia sp. Cy-641]
MILNSFKYSVRSFIRDMIRGVPARLLIYPRLKRNERSNEALRNYLQRGGAHFSARPDVLGIVDDVSSCIDKEVVRKEPQRFIVGRSLTTLLRNKIKTSGSTGRPLVLVQDIWAVIKEEAFVYRQLRWAGYRHGERRVWLRGDIVARGADKRQTYGCRDWWSNTLMLSSYHISSETARSYIESMRKFDPVLIQAYPSSISALASWLIASGMKFDSTKLKAIVTSSETLTGEMKDRIEEAFGCRVFDWYGHAERLVAIGTCEQGGRHVLSDYGRTELIPMDDGRYELVGTGYNNRAMPLTRYRTGDFVTLDGKRCTCGCIFPTVSRVLGRNDKVVTLSDGRMLGRLDHVFKGVPDVVEGQVVYKGDNRFVLKVVAGPEWSRTGVEQLIKNMKSRVDGVTVEVEEVDAIPRKANGKFEFVLIEETT